MWKNTHIITLLTLIILYFTGCHSREERLPEEQILSQNTLDEYRDSINKNPYKAIRMLDSIRQTVSDSTAFYQLSNCLVIAYYYTNKIDSALLLNKQIIDFAEKNPPSAGKLKLIISSCNNRGVLLQHVNMKDSAITCLLNLYNLLNTTDTDKTPLRNVCLNLAENYFHNGKYPQTSYYYRRGLALADSLKDESAYFPFFAGLARLYQEMENYELADEFFTKAEKHWENSRTNEKHFFSNCRGLFYMSQKDYDKALAWFRRAESLLTLSSPSLNYAITYGNTGEVFLLKGKNDSARYYLDKAKSYMDGPFKHPSIDFYVNALYATLALKENDLAKAERYLKQPYDTAEINPQYVYYHHKRMHELYLKKGDYKTAYRFLSIATRYNDSLRNMKIYNNIAETDSRYKQDTILIRKDAQIDIAKEKAGLWQKIASLAIVLLVLLVALIIGIIFYRRKTREVEYQKQVAMIAGLRMEIIRNRLSPHFMFNALNAIMPTLENYKELEQPFRLLIQLLRSNLQISEQIAIPLEKEIELVKYYLQLYSIKNTDIPMVEWQVSEQVSMEINIPSMSIQIPVENAVKYAFTSENKAPSIRIRVDLFEERYIKITIADNGKGYMPANNSNDGRGTGNGLKMLHRTFDILNTKNEEKIDFKIENVSRSDPESRGTLVTLIIPLNYRFKL